MESHSRKPSNSRQACPICERQFDRAEHLKRHLSTHTKERDRICRVCGRKFSRKDALDRHQNVHRPHVPLRRFRACTKCAASRVKCNGAQPCTRCEKKSLACTFPEASESNDVSAGADPPHGDAQYTGPQSDEMQAISIAEQQQVQQQHSVVPMQEHRTQACVFMQQQIHPVDLMPHETNTHMISALNWISPSMDLDLTEFDYNPIASSEQYWSSSTGVNDLSSQLSPTTAQPMGTIGAQSNTIPGTFSDSPDTETSGMAYVDNRGARKPRNGRYANRIFSDEASRGSPRTFPELPVMPPEPEGFNFMLTPSLNVLAQDLSSTIRIQLFTLEQYRLMCQAFQECCLTPNGASDDGPFLSTELPPMTTFTTLLALYRQYFDPGVLPLIHLGLDSEETSCWVSKLAMSAIGSHYLEMGDMELAVALHEFLRRVLRPQRAVFSAGILTTESLGMVQAKVLNYIGSTYCGSRRLERYRTPALEDLVNEYRAMYRTQPAILKDEISFRDRRHWMLLESARRLCHAIWLVESMSHYHFGTPSTLLLDFANIALPCTEDVWEAEMDQIRAPIKQPTLEKVLRVLYVEKRLLHGIGDFAQVLTIHGLYCQTWDVFRSFNKPLLRWTPSAQIGNAESRELTGPSWLPQIPLYNQWRNAACDCLDVLHWIANSEIAKRGTENSTVLHLHFARLVLLTPYQTIREMAELLVSENVRHGSAAERFREQCQEVQKWITDDQYKARLALVHCGVFFWHIRRYSMDAFFEPGKVFLATLVVWAYGSFCPPQQLSTSSRESMNTSSRDEGEWSSDLEDISSIRLDRPTDDELVQIFIKRGRSMNATIMGVGNITAPNGPLRMLREGCKLLNTLNKWPIRSRYLHILTQLITVCGQDNHWRQMGSNARQTHGSASP